MDNLSQSVNLTFTSVIEILSPAKKCTTPTSAYVYVYAQRIEIIDHCEPQNLTRPLVAKSNLLCYNYIKRLDVFLLCF